jgi:hypothetical protein
MRNSTSVLSRYLHPTFRVLTVDVGGAKQVSDRSAITSWLVELPVPVTRRMEPLFTLEHAERMPPGLGSEGVADEYCRQWQFYTHRRGNRVLPVVDSNGIGATVFQILKTRGLRPLGLVASGNGHEIDQPAFYNAASEAPAAEISVPTSIMVTRPKH